LAGLEETAAKIIAKIAADILIVRIPSSIQLGRDTGNGTICKSMSGGCRKFLIVGSRTIGGVAMALIRCMECGREVSDKATTCPNCGAPVDPASAPIAPDKCTFSDGEFIATSDQLVDLTKKAVNRLKYRVDTADSSSGTVVFTTGVTMGSWPGVSGTISWEEAAPFHWRVTGQGKQNVKGGQVVALNLFDEANAKARNVIAEMERLAKGGSEDEMPAGGCLVVLLALPTAAAACLHFATGLI
jgi:hypothetical protein